jgi:hypothetical protein
MQVGDRTVVLEAQALAVRWPYGGFVWNRPLAVRIQEAGATSRLPIVDATRAGQIALWGLAFLFAVINFGLAFRERIDG